MEAPIPASALIHSATLVSLGIYILLKFNILFLLFKLEIYIYGLLTALYSGIIAIYQIDLKKILAYSTISHCGILVFLTTFQLNYIVLIYLYIHGIFKALSFIYVGLIIKNNFNNQNLEHFGQSIKFSIIFYYFLLFCLINLSGLPYFFGFFIKHFILENVIYIYFFNYLISLTSFFYCYKIIYYIFFSIKKYNKLNIFFFKKLNKIFDNIFIFLNLFFIIITIIIIFYIFKYFYIICIYSKIIFLKLYYTTK